MGTNQSGVKQSLPIVPGIVVLRSFKMKELQEDRRQAGDVNQVR
jgi:hypothetical protein